MRENDEGRNQNDEWQAGMLDVWQKESEVKDKSHSQTGLSAVRGCGETWLCLCHHASNHAFPTFFHRSAASDDNNEGEPGAKPDRFVINRSVLFDGAPPQSLFHCQIVTEK
jgi:hypothetical protein